MFGLDPQSMVQRVKASPARALPPTFSQSLRRGASGFTLVSLAGFAPWIFAGRWFYRHGGEAGLYAVCALMFIGLSGVFLHRLIIGPGSLIRFYKIFSLAFVAYALAWMMGWMALRGFAGSVVGLLAGTMAMGAVLAGGFAARGVVWKIIAVLFLTNALGYFVGEGAHHFIAALPEKNFAGITLDQSFLVLLSKMAWGLCYGLSFGAGIGFGFYCCQMEAARLVRSSSV